LEHCEATPAFAKSFLRVNSAQHANNSVNDSGVAHQVRLLVADEGRVNDPSGFSARVQSSISPFVTQQRDGRTRPVLLIADSDVPGRQSLAAYLRHNNLTIHEAGSGVEAIDAAELKQPDLILLDIRLPDSDGPTAVLDLKANPATAQIPVITLAPFHLRRKQEHCRVAGAVGSLTKPAAPGEILDAINTYFAKAAIIAKSSY
jgi:CheY-like chemotaxis protein